jgi:hypothetical protein
MKMVHFGHLHLLTQLRSSLVCSIALDLVFNLIDKLKCSINYL